MFKLLTYEVKITLFDFRKSFSELKLIKNNKMKQQN